MRSASLCSVLVLLFAALCSAQGTTVNAVRGRVSERMVVGSTTLGDVLRIVGASTVSSGTGTMNPFVLDADGDGLEDTNTTVSTTGAWTFGTSIGGTSTLSITTPTAVTGNLSSTGAMFARGDVPIAATGVDEVRMGKRATFNWPTILLEDAGQMQWNIDNVAGQLRMFRRNTAGDVVDDPLIPLTIDGNITIGPYGRRLLPSTPYGVDIGSQQYKFGALWTGDLYADRLVTIENIGTVDNRWLIGSGNVLDEDLSPSATSMVTRYNNYATGTFVYLQKFARTEFIKTASGPTLTNQISNGSFESGATTGWTTSAGMTGLSNVTTKSFHGERSMLADASANPSTFLYSTFATTPGTTYTTCLYARRTDGAAIDGDDIGIYHAAGYIDVAAQPTQTDGWYRLCLTSAAGTAPGSQQVHINTKGVDYYIDAVQTEVTSTQRPYSEYRASYSISRNEEGGGGVANQWYAGDGMMSVGASTGDGWLDCYAIRGTKSATEQGPACVANVRIGSSYNSWAPFAAWGNLDGLYGISGTRWGFRAGWETLTALGADTVDGFTIKTNGVMKMQFDTSGNGFLAGSLAVTNNITVGQAGAIMSGATAYDTGEGYWLDCNYTSGACDPRFRIGTTSAGTSYLRWTGSAIDMKSNTLAIDTNGILMTSNTTATYSAPYGYRFSTGLSNSAFALGSYEDGSTRQMALVNTTSTASGRAMRIVLQAGQSASNANVEVFNNNAGNVGVTLSSPSAAINIIDQALSFSGITSMNVNAGIGVSGTVVVPCGTLTFTHGWLTSKGTC